MPTSSLGFVPTVLVVDDIAANRELARSILEPEFTVREAEDGARALEIATTQPIDLILLDVMMPGLSGFEVTRGIRAARRGDYLPIILVTSLTETADRVAGFEAGADDYITKPINPQELRLRVRAFARTRELHQERAAMLEDLERLHELKDDLAALLVHDLRNPLAGLTYALEALDEEAMSASARETVADARLAVERLQDMVDELLQVRLLEDRARAIDLEARPVSELLSGAVQTLAPVARERGVRLAIRTGDGTLLRCDAALVRRAVENLLANAVRHAPRASEVAIGLEWLGPALRIVVEDEGQGIPGDQRAHLFDKYGGRDRRRRGLRSGHGLGLYLVSLVMRAHGGSVFVDESAARGTRVVLEFPYAGMTVEGGRT